LFVQCEDERYRYKVAGFVNSVSEREAVKKIHSLFALYPAKKFLDPSSWWCRLMMLKVYTAGEEEEER
jgi:hypothetical protein